MGKTRNYKKKALKGKRTRKGGYLFYPSETDTESEDTESDDCDCYGRENCPCELMDENCKYCMNSDNECIRCDNCYNLIDIDCVCNNDENEEYFLNENQNFENSKPYSGKIQLLNNYKNWYNNLSIL